jgi:hypothetical protein
VVFFRRDTISPNGVSRRETPLQHSTIVQDVAAVVAATILNTFVYPSK